VASMSTSRPTIGIVISRPTVIVFVGRLIRSGLVVTWHNTPVGRYVGVDIGVGRIITSSTPLD
jgi:hypothetical protein